MAFGSVDPGKFEWDNIAVELSDEMAGTLGRIIDPGFAGLGERRVAMPPLLAYRAQASRFFRMARMIGAARALAFTELGADGPALLDAALVSITDLKGDFTVIWRETNHRAALEAIVARALLLEGENPQDQMIHTYEKPDGAR